MNSTADNERATIKDNRKKSAFICAYEKCMLPKKELGKCVLQCCYLFMASLQMQMDVNNYTILPAWLFLFPILLDFCFANITSKLWRVLRVVGIVVAGVLFAVSVLWYMNYFVYDDKSMCFMVNVASDVFSGFYIPKKVLSYCFVAMSFYPIVLYVGAPNAVDSEFLNYVVLQE